jgi:hypothetical protein
MANLILNGSTSGSVTLSSPAVSGTTTLTLPATSGTVITTASTFAGTGPAFSAYQSSAQTLSTYTATKLTFTTEEFDTNSNFASSTFTPTISGYYQINAGFELNSTNAGMTLMLYKNGSLFKRLFNTNNTTTFHVSGSTLVYANGSTDYFEIYGTISSGQALVANAYATYFSGSMVRSA